MQDEILDMGETAELLGISKASVRNWRKHGYLQAVDPKGRFFLSSQVLRMKEALQEGKIDRLKKRANKIQAGKCFMPTEYIKKEESRLKIGHLIEYIRRHDMEKRMAILILALNLFHLNGDLKSKELVRLLAFQPQDFQRKSVFKELKGFYTEIRKDLESFQEINWNKDEYEFIFQTSLPAERDILGIVYQSLTKEGQKASLGIYFTPQEIVEGMVKKNLESGQKVIDPCCGTGQFLLSFADFLQDPDAIWGMDIDRTAVTIARLNLLLRFPGEFHPRVFHLDTLGDIAYRHTLADSWEKDFDMVATNPPWGAKLTKKIWPKLRAEFPEITSEESFAYFLRAGLSFLKEGGRLSFVLPESVLNVHTHSDIRKVLLDNCQIKRIECLGQRFKNVLSSVICLDLVKKKPIGNERVLIRRPGEEYQVAQRRFLKNKWHVFDVYLTEQDEKILGKVLQTKHITLEGKADWALGIVTGDNKKFLERQPLEGYEPIYKGSDVGVFTLREPQNYIKFTPEAFQQVAPEEKYRTKEKLIYKFISGIPVFAYDNQGSLTLNSANILILKCNYPLKVILALFNSSLYGFLYRKKVHSLKILKGDLEQLPLPLWEKEVLDNIAELVDKIIRGEQGLIVLDNYLLELFGLSEEEKSYIRSCSCYAQ